MGFLSEIRRGRRRVRWWKSSGNAAGSAGRGGGKHGGKMAKLGGGIRQKPQQRNAKKQAQKTECTAQNRAPQKSNHPHDLKPKTKKGNHMPNGQKNKPDKAETKEDLQVLLSYPARPSPVNRNQLFCWKCSAGKCFARKPEILH